MKFRCERDVLLEAISNAQRATSPRPTVQVLVGIHLVLRGDSLTITGSDLHLTITTTIVVSGESDGEVVLQGKLTADIIRSLEAGAVTVEAEAHQAHISAGRSKFDVVVIPSEEYPNFTDVDGEQITIDARSFEEGLKQVVRAASHDETRITLTGVLIASEDSGIRMVSTDSYRLAVRDLPSAAAVLGEGDQVLVPSRALNELSRIIRNEEQITLVIGESDIMFETGSVTLRTKLIEEQYPAYRNLIALERSNRLIIDRLSLLDAVKRVRLMVSDSSGTATAVRLNLDADHVELVAENPERGRASESVDATYSGAQLTVAFNPDYLIDGLDATPGEVIFLDTVDEERPALMGPMDDDEFRYVLMPVRVS